MGTVEGFRVSTIKILGVGKIAQQLGAQVVLIEDLCILLCPLPGSLVQFSQQTKATLVLSKPQQNLQPGPRSFQNSPCLTNKLSFVYQVCAKCAEKRN